MRMKIVWLLLLSRKVRPVRNNLVAVNIVYNKISNNLTLYFAICIRKSLYIPKTSTQLRLRLYSTTKILHNHCSSAYSIGCVTKRKAQLCP